MSYDSRDPRADADADSPPPPGRSGNPFAEAESPPPEAPEFLADDDDIAAEQALYARLRREPGLFKARDKAPNLFVIAWRTPGELAVMALSVLFYVLGLAALVILGGESVNRIPGIFQCVILGILVIPAFMLGGRTWRALGRRGRDVVRLLIRLWPVTLPAGVLLLGGVARLAGR